MPDLWWCAMIPDARTKCLRLCEAQKNQKSKSTQHQPEVTNYSVCQCTRREWNINIFTFEKYIIIRRKRLDM